MRTLENNEGPGKITASPEDRELIIAFLHDLVPVLEKHSGVYILMDRATAGDGDELAFDLVVESGYVETLLDQITGKDMRVILTKLLMREEMI